MSGRTESLRRKIESAGELNSVVRSMKALAASSIGQYEDAVESLNHYYRTVELGLAACLRRSAPIVPPSSRNEKGPKKIGIVVFGSDQGLIGQFNEILAKFTLDWFKPIPGRLTNIWGVGECIQALIFVSGSNPVIPLEVPTSVFGITRLIDRILIDIEAARERGDIDDVYIFHNRPKTGAIFEPVARRLLPLDHLWQNSLAVLPWPTKNPPEVIGEKQDVFDAFVRGYLFVLLFQACAESLASENASRLAAMQRAEKNIQEVLEDLSRTFHRIRQESIDEELFDVISGYEARAKVG